MPFLYVFSAKKSNTGFIYLSFAQNKKKTDNQGDNKTMFP